MPGVVRGVTRTVESQEAEMTASVGEKRLESAPSEG